MIDLKRLRREKKLTQADLSEIIGVRQVEVSRIENGKRGLTFEQQRRLEARFDDIQDYRITGPRETGEAPYIPYYDVDIVASSLEVFNNQTTRPDYLISVPGFADCDFACNVYGDSMYPTFESGCIVICKEIHKPFNYFQFGEAYLIITRDYRMLKRIQRAENTGYIVARSDNQIETGKYEDIVVPVDEILKLYIVKGTLKRNQL